MDEKTRQQVSEAIADHDAAHPHWRQERRDREIREAQEAEARAHRAVQAQHQEQQQRAANNTQAWCAWVDERIVATIKADREVLHHAIGQVVSEERAARRKEIKAAVDEAKQWVGAKLDALENRLFRQFELQSEIYNKAVLAAAKSTQTLDEKIEKERADRQTEIKATAEETRRAFETKLEVLEQRIVQRNEQRIIQHIEQCSERTNALRDGLATERTDRQKEVKAAVEEAKRAVEAKLEALEQHIERHTEQCNHGIAVSTGRAATFGKMIETERADRQKEVKAAVEETKRAVEAEVEALEQHIKRHTEQCNHGIAVSTGRAETFGKTIETERADRQKEIKTAVEETQRVVEAKVAALEERLKAVPGKLPVARTWHPESVTYQSEFVSHDGALWQARQDTATTPGSADWVCVARAGRDAITPNVRGTFSVDETYKQLDIVVHDGAAWIARCDDPGICPGDGWQLMSKQGKTGRPGTPGERGPRGEKGDQGDPGRSLVSWQVDRAKYRASPLWSDGAVGPNLELHGLYEQYQDDTGDS